MSDKEDGGPAFPRDDYLAEGMSLRDYFAAKAMQGMLSAPYHPASDEFMMARDAYTAADAMIAERSK